MVEIAVSFPLKSYIPVTASYQNGCQPFLNLLSIYPYVSGIS